MAKIVRALDCWLLTWCRELQCEVRKFVTLDEAKAWCVVNEVDLVLVMESVAQVGGRFLVDGMDCRE